MRNLAEFDSTLDVLGGVSTTATGKGCFVTTIKVFGTDKKPVELVCEWAIDPECRHRDHFYFCSVFYQGVSSHPLYRQRLVTVDLSEVQHEQPEPDRLSRGFAMRFLEFLKVRAESLIVGAVSQRLFGHPQEVVRDLTELSVTDQYSSGFRDSSFYEGFSHRVQAYIGSGVAFHQVADQMLANMGDRRAMARIDEIYGVVSALGTNKHLLSALDTETGNTEKVGVETVMKNRFPSSFCVRTDDEVYAVFSSVEIMEREIIGTGDTEQLAWADAYNKTDKTPKQLMKEHFPSTFCSKVGGKYVIFSTEKVEERQMEGSATTASGAWKQAALRRGLVAHESPE